MAATLFLLEDVDLSLELAVRGHRAGGSDHHATLDVLLVDATEEQTDVVASLTAVEDLAEHLHTRDGGLHAVGIQTEDVDLVTGVDDARLDPARGHGSTTRDREHVLHGHQERLLIVANGQLDVLVHSVHELEDRVDPLLLTIEGAQSGTLDAGHVVSVVLVEAEELTHLHLDELEQLLIVDHVDLVEEGNDARDTHLTAEQDVLTGLGHRAVRGGHNEDSAVHLGGTRHHVLHVVGVAGAVNVGVVPVGRRVLDVRGVDGDTTLLFLGSVVNLVKGGCLAETSVGQHFRDGGGEGRLAVVNVTEGPDVHVRLGTIKRFFSHGCGCLWVT